MSYLIWILCLIVITHNRHTEASVQGVPISALSPRVSSSEKTPPTCTNFVGSKCGDCKELWTCFGGVDPLKKDDCEKIYPGQPYCVDGSCSSLPDPNDEECSTTGITCTGQGYFPNPLNCSQYFFCAKLQGASMAYECPNGFVYNSVARECRRRIIPSDCRIVTNCAANPGKYVPYPGDTSYYVWCLIGSGSVTPLVFKCPDSEQFIQSKQQCEFQCKKEGRIADAKDCDRYYECFPSGLTFITYHQKCLTGFKFSSEENGCVEGTCPDTVADEPDTDANDG